MISNNENKIYNLQQLKKELLELKLNQPGNFVINEFNSVLGNIYGLFSSDNSFLFVKEKSCLEFNYNLSVLGYITYVFKIIFSGYPLISKKYHLIDFFSRTYISDEYEEKFNDGDKYEYNGTEYYVILLSKIIPASFLTNISLSNVSVIQDAINVFLAENPDFINQVFSEEHFEQSESTTVKSKRLALSTNINEQL